MTRQSDANYLSQTTFRAGLVQSRAYRILNQAMGEWLAPFNLNLTEWALIGVLSEQGAARPNELATALGVSAPMCTKILNKLDERGLVQRRSVTTDRRESSADLTSKGRALAGDVESVVRQSMRQFLAGITPEQLIGYLAVLDFLATK